MADWSASCWAVASDAAAADDFTADAHSVITPRPGDSYSLLQNTRKWAPFNWQDQPDAPAMTSSWDHDRDWNAPSHLASEDLGHATPSSTLIHHSDCDMSDAPLLAENEAPGPAQVNQAQVSTALPGRTGKPKKKTAAARRARWPTAAEVKYRPENHRRPSEEPSNGQHPLDDGTGALKSTFAWEERAPSLYDTKRVAWIKEWTMSLPQMPVVKSFGHVATLGSLDWKNRQTSDQLFNYTILDDGRAVKTLALDIALKQWLPEASFMSKFQDSELPDDEDDIALWWTRFISPGSQFLEHLEHPETLPSPESSGVAYHYKTETCVEVWLSLSGDRKKKPLHSSMQIDLQLPSLAIDQPLAEHELKPTANFYLRPAKESDMPALRSIWNHYIANDIVTPEMEKITFRDMRHRWADIIADNLPCLVAVDLSSKGNNQRRREQVLDGQPIRGDHILGFAFATDYHSPKGMYRFTVEVEIYTRPTCLRKGVASCLLDKTLSILDPAYLPRFGYEFASDECKYNAGGERNVQSILVSLPFDMVDPDALAWKVTWLKQSKFVPAGTLFDIGRKNDRRVGLQTLVRKTLVVTH